MPTLPTLTSEQGFLWKQQATHPWPMHKDRSMRKPCFLTTWAVLWLTGTGYSDALIYELKKNKIASIHIPEDWLSDSNQCVIDRATLQCSGGHYHINGREVVFLLSLNKALAMWLPGACSHYLASALWIRRLSFPAGPCNQLFQKGNSEESNLQYQLDGSRQSQLLKPTCRCTGSPHKEPMVPGQPEWSC